MVDIRVKSMRVINSPVGQRINELRNRLGGISRVELAKKIGLGSGLIIYMWETEHRTPTSRNCFKLIDLAKTVGLEWTMEMLRPRKE